MNTDRFLNYSFILAPIFWILWGIIVIYYSCVITYDSVSHKIHSILSKNKETDYEVLENKLRDDDSLFHMFKQTYAFCDLYESLSFRDKLKIKMGSMTWPQVGVSEEIENMSAHEFLILLNESSE